MSSFSIGILKNYLKIEKAKQFVDLLMQERGHVSKLGVFSDQNSKEFQEEFYCHLQNYKIIHGQFCNIIKKS